MMKDRIQDHACFLPTTDFLILEDIRCYLLNTTKIMFLLQKIINVRIRQAVQIGSILRAQSKRREPNK